MASGLPGGLDGRQETNQERLNREYAAIVKQQKEREKAARRREVLELKRDLREGFDAKPVFVVTGRSGRGKAGKRSFESWVLQRRKLTIREFRGAVKSGGFRTVHLEARGPFFFVEGEPRVEPERGKVQEDSRMLLVVDRGRKQRLFQNPASALEMLWGMGVKNVEVHMEDWQPGETEMLNKPRPDMAERLRFAHEYGREASGG